MDRIKKILAPTDLSEHSKAGVRYALDLAHAVGAEVTVYYVVDHIELMNYTGPRRGNEDAAGHRNPFAMSDLLEWHQVALARFLGKEFSDIIPRINIREKVEIGVPDTNIVARAKTEASDVIVISTHGRTGLSHLLLGSVTEKVVRSAPCPVISIHPDRIPKVAGTNAAVA